MNTAHAAPPDVPPESSIHKPKPPILQIYPDPSAHRTRPAVPQSRGRLWLKIVGGAAGLTLLSGTGADLARKSIRASRSGERHASASYSDAAGPMYQWYRFYRIAR